MPTDADAALAALAQGYIHQQFNVPTGQWPGATEVSRVFAQLLQGQFGGQEATLLAHPRFRLRVFTSRGRVPLLHHGARWATPLGHAAAFASNLVRRRALGAGCSDSFTGKQALIFIIGDILIRREFVNGPPGFYKPTAYHPPQLTRNINRNITFRYRFIL